MERPEYLTKEKMQEYMDFKISTDYIGEIFGCSWVYPNKWKKEFGFGPNRGKCKMDKTELKTYMEKEKSIYKDWLAERGISADSLQTKPKERASKTGKSGKTGKSSKTGKTGKTGKSGKTGKAETNKKSRKKEKSPIEISEASIEQAKSIALQDHNYSALEIPLKNMKKCPCTKHENENLDVINEGYEWPKETADNEFVNLHLHTEYSLLDGCGKVKRYSEKCKELGMPAMAITDHGSLSGIFKFHHENIGRNIKTIIGCETYEVDDRKRIFGIREELTILDKSLRNLESFSSYKKPNIVARKKMIDFIDTMWKDKKGKMPEPLRPIMNCSNDDEIREVDIEPMRSFFQGHTNEVRIQVEKLRLEREISSSNYHLLFLAKTPAGYKNLLRMTSEAWISGYYYRPRLDWELISQYGDGLITTTTCLGSRVNQLILNDKQSEAEELILAFKDRWGDDFYVEIEFNELGIQRQVNSFLIEMIQKHNLDPLATVDCHYVDKKDVVAHSILLMLQQKKVISDLSQDQWLELARIMYPDRNDEERCWVWKRLKKQKNSELDVSNAWQFEARKLFLKDRKMILEDWEEYGSNVPEDIIIQGMKNTVKIAKECVGARELLKFEKYKVPIYDVKKSRDYDEYKKFMHDPMGEDGETMLQLVCERFGVDPETMDLMEKVTI